MNRRKLLSAMGMSSVAVAVPAVALAERVEPTFPPLVYRCDRDYGLTIEEMDQNFRSLDQRIARLEKLR